MMAAAASSQPPAELPITGYLDRWSARPGETIAVHASVTTPGPCQAELVRIISADPNPDGPGMDIRSLAEVFHTEFAGRHQPIHQGSYAVVNVGPLTAVLATAATTWTAWIHPTHLTEEPQAILSGSGQGSIRLTVSRAGVSMVVTGVDGQTVAASSAEPMTAGRWWQVWGSWEPEQGVLSVGQYAPPQGYDPQRLATAATPPAALGTPLVMQLLIAAASLPEGTAPATERFNGRIEDPAILQGVLSSDYLLRLDLAIPPQAMLAGWDFSQDIPSQRISDVGSHGLDGQLVNLPTRGVTGRRWTGEEHCWRHAPQEYAAIHFHEDDLGSCGWGSDCHFTLPEDLPSGCYGIRIRQGEQQDILPFYGVPPRHPVQGSRPRIAFLASVYTYQVYGNHARGNCDDAYRARRAAWPDAYPYNPDEYPIYGRSLYNKHPDGTGLCYASRERPLLTVRPGFFTFVDEAGSGLRHFPADSHLLAWLEAMGHSVDIITDVELDREGTEVLEPYSVLLTGSHPEYHTDAMLNTLETYLNQGGRLCYLGGNGFYWRIVRSPDCPEVIEVRRAEGGIRAWASQTGEYYHAFDGCLGGLWRRLGRPPQRLVGVGFTAQGIFEGSHYRRQPASYQPDYAWMFAGVDSETFGEQCLSGGGAAGFELDRVDFRLGSPADTVIVARSEDHQNFVLVPEELLTHIATESGEQPAALLRSEIVHCPLPSGGDIFSVGSISFCGALPVNNFANPVSRLLDNVVRRFAAD